jgi:hypothetical protein
MEYDRLLVEIFVSRSVSSSINNVAGTKLPPGNVNNGREVDVTAVSGDDLTSQTRHPRARPDIPDSDQTSQSQTRHPRPD